MGKVMRKRYAAESKAKAADVARLRAKIVQLIVERGFLFEAFGR